MTKDERLAQVNEQIKNEKTLQWNASQMRQAAMFGRLERELDSLYREKNKLMGRR